MVAKGRAEFNAAYLLSNEKLTIIDSSSADTVSLMFLESFDWNHMTSIILAVSHLFSYVWIFLERKKFLLDFACILLSTHYWKCLKNYHISMLRTTRCYIWSEAFVFNFNSLYFQLIFFPSRDFCSYQKN